MLCLSQLSDRKSGPGDAHFCHRLSKRLPALSSFAAMTQPLPKVSLRIEHPTHSPAHPSLLQLFLGCILGACLPVQGVPRGWWYVSLSTAKKEKMATAQCSEEVYHLHIQAYIHTETWAQSRYLHTQADMKAYANTSQRQTIHTHT